MTLGFFFRHVQVLSVSVHVQLHGRARPGPPEKYRSQDKLLLELTS